MVRKTPGLLEFNCSGNSSGPTFISLQMNMAFLTVRAGEGIGVEGHNDEKLSSA